MVSPATGMLRQSLSDHGAHRLICFLRIYYSRPLEGALPFAERSGRADEISFAGIGQLANARRVQQMAQPVVVARTVEW
jgi:hypothetical protein